MRRFAVLFLFLLLATLPGHAQSVAPAPSLLNFQGRLAKPDGTPVSDGTYSVRFSLWNVASGGTQVANEKWSQTSDPITVKNGVFAVLLGSGNAFPAGLFSENLWLELKIGNDPALTPRQQIVSVAYALKANTVPDGAITTPKIADGAITPAKVQGGVFAPGGAAGGDLTGTYPNPSLLTDARLLPKVSANALLPNGTTTQSFFDPGGSTFDSADGLSDYWQSFVPVATGRLSSLGLSLNNTAIASLKIYEGEGTDGPLLYSGDMTLPLDYVSLPNGPFLTAGKKYTFRVTSTTLLAVLYASTNIYPAGRSSLSAGKDLHFSFYMDVTSPTTISVLSRLGIGSLTPTAPLEITGNGGPTLQFLPGYLFGANNPNAFTLEMPGSKTLGIWDDLSVSGKTTVGKDLTVSMDLSVGRDQSVSRDLSIGDDLTVGTRVGIGTTSPIYPLHIVDPRTTGSANILFESPAPAGTWLRLKNASTNGDEWSLISAGSSNGEGAGKLLFYNNGTRVVFDQNGRVGIGISNPTYKLQVNGSVAGVGNYNNVSDARYKQNVATFPNALEAILALRGVTFDWRKRDFPTMEFSEGRQIGFLAQEVEKVLPELVTTDTNGYKSVAYANVVPVLVEAVKTLHTENTDLRKRLERLEAMVAGLQSTSTKKR